MDNKIIGIIVLVLIVVGLIWWSLQSKREATPATMTNSSMLTQKADVAIDTREVEYLPGVKGFYAAPQQGSNQPGVVMMHEWWGLNQNIKDMAGELAKEGYQVLAVDLHKGRVATTQQEAQQLVAALNQEEALNNMKAAVAYLQTRGATKIASLGWCFGGGQSLQLALSGQPLNATVIYYGSLVTDPTKLSVIKWPVLGIFGDKDMSIPVASVNQFDAALDQLGVANSINIYPGVGHAFANPSGMNYAPAETKDAWAKTVAFLNSNLK